MGKPYTLVAIGGKKQSGKDTLASFIQKHLNEDFKLRTETMHFADPIRNILKYLVGIDPDTTHTEEGKQAVIPWITNPLDASRPTTVRSLMQWMGTEVGRALHPNLWVKRLLDEIEVDKPLEDERRLKQGLYCIIPTDVFIVPDQRFDNELVRAPTPFSPHLDKTFHIRISRKGAPVGDGHASEQLELIPTALYDLEVENNGTLADLEEVAVKCSSLIASLRRI